MTQLQETALRKYQDALRLIRDVPKSEHDTALSANMRQIAMNALSEAAHILKQQEFDDALKRVA